MSLHHNKIVLKRMHLDKMGGQEREQISLDVRERWRNAWEVVSARYEGGTSLREISEVFLKSIFRPDLLGEIKPTTTNGEIVGKLKSPGYYASLAPNEGLMLQARRELVASILDTEPVFVSQAQETITELAQKSRFHIWTVGDYVGSTNTTSDTNPGSAYDGSGHQLWKLWKAGLTNREDIEIHVADNKFTDLSHKLATLRDEGVEEFVFFDDRVANLNVLKMMIDQENLERESMGDNPITCKLVLVNQGSRKTEQPELIDTRGSLVDK